MSCMLRFDKKQFFDNFKPWFKETTGKNLSAKQVAALDFLLESFEEWGGSWQDIRNVAYAFATTAIETAWTFEPIVEKGSKSYFNKYDIKFNPKKARQLGNVSPGDGFLFRGRGYCQITGRSNYRHFDIENDPDRALQPQTAFDIMVSGMLRGTFTGKKLSDYINDSKTDYVGARRIINGQDRAKEIAKYARQLEVILRLSQSSATASAGSGTNDKHSTTQTHVPLLESPTSPSDNTSRINFIDRVFTPIQDAKSKFDQLGVDPGTISKSSAVTTTVTKLIGYFFMGLSFLKENPIYLLAGVGLVIAGVYVFSNAKKNATVRVTTFHQ